MQERKRSIYVNNLSIHRSYITALMSRRMTLKNDVKPLSPYFKSSFYIFHIISYTFILYTSCVHFIIQNSSISYYLFPFFIEFPIHLFWSLDYGSMMLFSLYSIQKYQQTLLRVLNIKICIEIGELKPDRKSLTIKLQIVYVFRRNIFKINFR